jgi:hypothetical protein
MRYPTFTKKKTEPKGPNKSTKWQPFKFGDSYYNNDIDLPFMIEEGLSFCCGVAEIGEIDEGSFIKNYEVYSVETNDDDEPWYTRPATFKEVLKGFQDYLAEYKTGMFECFLLKSQHEGNFGKLIKADNWVYHGSFMNPNTRNILHHWTKVTTKAPSYKKRVKSVLRRK